MIDRTAKILLGAIAAGLWANVATTQVGATKADTAALGSIDTHLNLIEAYTSIIRADIASIADGKCRNGKLC